MNVRRAFEFTSQHLGTLGALAAAALLLAATLFTGFSPLDWLWERIEAPAIEQARQERIRQQVAQRISEGEGYLGEGLYAEARRAFEEAAGLDPANRAAAFGMRKAGLLAPGTDGEYRPERVEGALAELLREAPDDPHLLTIQGNLRLQEGNPEAAARAYRAALAPDRRWPEASYGLGVAALSERRYDLARRHFEEALKGSREKVRYQAAFAQSLALLGDYPAAADRYRRALAADPDDLLLHAEHALVLLHLGRLDEARAAAEGLMRRLDDPRTAGLKKNSGAWGFPLPEEKTGVLYLQEGEEKRRFARALAAALELLAGREEAARRLLAGLGEPVRLDQPPLWIVTLELALYSKEHPGQEGAAARFTALLPAAP